MTHENTIRNRAKRGQVVLSYASGEWFTACGFHNKHIPKAASFIYNGNEKIWHTAKYDNAVKLADYADQDALNALREAQAERGSLLEESRATDSDFEVPTPDGEEYLGYQKAGIEFASKREGTLIGDEMGLGKTMQAIGVTQADKSIKDVLVICPATLKLNWKREFEKWSVREISVRIIKGKNQVLAANGADLNITIINYDIVGKHRKMLAESGQWDLMIVDECHYLKSGRTKRTQQVLGKWDSDEAKRIDPIPARKKLMLTGTPILNRPIELYTILKSITPVFRNWKKFVERYCGAVRTRHGWDVSGATNLEELAERLRSTVMIRRLKADVLSELPAKRRQVIEIPTNGMSEAVKAEMSAFAQQELRLEVLRNAVASAEISDDENAHRDAVRNLNEGTFAAFTEMARLRHLTAVEKVPHVISHLQNAIETSDKVVVFAHHKDVVAAIMEAFDGIAVKITGETPVDKRQGIVDSFQNDPSIKLFVGNMKAAGVGITLTAASHVVFAELDWVPANLSQAEDRCHRIGQTDSVLVQHIVLEDSMDSTMANRVIEKQENIEKALGGDRVVTLPKKAVKLIDKLQEKATAVFDEPKIRQLTNEEIEAIQKKIRFLANSCDGALSQDGAGFNKLDTQFGKSLARQTGWTQRQANAALKLTTKYRRQLSRFA